MVNLKVDLKFERSSLFVQGNVNDYGTATTVHIFPFHKRGFKVIFGHISGNIV